MNCYYIFKDGHLFIISYIGTGRTLLKFKHDNRTKPKNNISRPGTS
jgi:hypothetical protein